MGTANGRVNHTEAQADKLGYGKGKHAKFMAVRMQGGWDFCWSRPKQGETGNWDKLTLNFSTSSSCNQEAWRLKCDLKTNSRTGRGGDKTMWSSCHHRQTGNDLEMGGGQTQNISPYEPEELVICFFLIFYFFIYFNMKLCITYTFRPSLQVFRCKYCSYDLLSLYYAGSVCRGQSCTAAVTDCDRHTKWYNYTLQLASIPPSAPFHPCLVFSGGYIPAKKCNWNTEVREPGRKWTGIEWTSSRVCTRSHRWRI